MQPLTAAEVQNVLRYCYAHDIAGHGARRGHGQLRPGGSACTAAWCSIWRAWIKIEEIRPEGVAVCEPGVRLGVLENEARKVGWELRCYPSTIIKASVGGFLGGGSGGIGSVAHGNLRDFQTVRALEVVTMEAEPRVVLHEGEAVHEILHAWGTNGIVTRIWLALAPAVEWSQCAIAFDTFDEAFDFSERIAADPAWTKRLVTPFEWPIPSFFTPVKQYAPEGKALIFFLIASDQLAALEAAARESGGEVTYPGAYLGLRTRPVALRLHLEPHDAVGDRAGRGLHLSAMRVRSGHGARTDATVEGALRRRNSVPHGILEERRRADDSRRDSAGLLHDGGALERNDSISAARSAFLSPIRT